MFILPPAVLLGLVLYVVVKILKAAGRHREAIHFGSGNGLLEYRENHPDCCRDGSVTCHACGGADIWLEKVNDGCFNHRCRTCAALLYQSNTNYASEARRHQRYRNVREWMEDERRKRQAQDHRTEPQHEDERVQ
jgi:hypothetical protein